MALTARDVKAAAVGLLAGVAVMAGASLWRAPRATHAGRLHTEITLAVGTEAGHTGRDEDGTYRDLFLFETEAQASVARQKALGALADFRVELFRQK